MRLRSAVPLALVATIASACGPPSSDDPLPATLREVDDGWELAVPICAGDDGIATIEVFGPDGTVDTSGLTDAPQTRRIVTITITNHTLRSGQFASGELDRDVEFDGTVPAVTDALGVYVLTSTGFVETKLSNQLRNSGDRWLLSGRSTPQPTDIEQSPEVERWCDEPASD
jgi:hypothetical protein